MNGSKIVCSNVSRFIPVILSSTHSIVVKDVHKAPPLDLVGWFTLAPPTGPQSHHLALHHQIIQNYNESALFLAFHPTSVADSKGGKLPFTIYETSLETATDNDDKRMQASDDAQPELATRFKEIPYTIESGEAEMISVDFVARGGGIATSAKEPQKMENVDGKGKGKSKGDDISKDDDTIPDVELLSAEDEELIASLTTKANAVRMLKERVALTKAYLTSIPSCYLNTPTKDPSAPVEMPSDLQISYPILRNISSMLARLPLLNAADTSATMTTTNGKSATTSSISAFSHEAAQQRTDAALVSLLGTFGSTLRTASDMGKKALAVEKAKSQSSQKSGGGMLQPQGMMPPSQGDFFDDYMEDEAYDDGDGGGVPDFDGMDGSNGADVLGGGFLPQSGSAFLDARLNRRFGAGDGDEEMS